MSVPHGTLVLNASYEPINVCSAKRAMVLVLKGAAVVEEVGPFVLRTSKMTFPLPSVVRLLVYRRTPKQARAVSRKSIMMRDGYRCQYCTKLFPAGDLTWDHVMPRSRGGGNTWENLVACCFDCNNKKGDRTPAEAKMTLAKQPRPFGLHAKHKMLSVDNATWGKYLFN